MSESNALATSKKTTIDNNNMFNLEPPQPVLEIKVEELAKTAGQTNSEGKSAGIVKVKEEVIKSLDTQVSNFITQLMSSEPESDMFKSIANSVSNMGTTEIKKTTAISNRMLDKPIKSMKEGVYDEGSEISKGLLDLRKTVEKLNPGSRGDLFNNVKKIFFWLPYSNKVDNYFKEYQSSQTHINAILESLYRGKDELMQDNASIDEEKIQLWDLMGKLEQFIYLAKRLDAKIEDFLPELEVSDSYKAKVVREDILFYVRQKHQDLLTHMAVTVQGYMALDMVKKNNIELMKGVDRSTTTTMSALRTAVTVCQALTNQKLVLDQINAVNRTTEQLIETNANLLGKQGVEIQRQATESSIKVEVLQKAFTQIFQAMDSMDTYKLQALENMKKTVTALDETVNNAKTYLDKNRQKAVQDVSSKIANTDDQSGVVNLLKQ